MTSSEAAYQPRSRRPHHSPHAVTGEVEDQIIRLRKELSKQGLDAGAETIRVHLAHRIPQPLPGDASVPAVSTIWRVLTRRGFVTAQPQKRPRSSWKHFCAEQPNERWQADTTHWRLADGTDVEILNIIDDHSRLNIASHTRRITLAPDVVTSFRNGFQHWGIPASVLTDNGAIFTARQRGEGRVALEIELGVLGVRFNHSRPYHPQTCGKVERFHQTQKKWLTAQRPATTLAMLQRHLDRFTDYYNNQRPHRALNRTTPAQAYASRPPATPTGPKIPAHYRIRNDTIDTGGSVTLRHNSRLHHIGLGTRHAETRVTLLIDNLHIRVIERHTGQLIRELILDPTRDYQPRGVPPGPPKQHTKRNDVPRHPSTMPETSQGGAEGDWLQDIVGISRMEVPMSKAQLVITAVKVERRSKSEVAREYGVSRYWVQLTPPGMSGDSVS